MNILTLSSLCILASALLASAQVPGLINYQGRLTDSSGAPVTGSKDFSLTIHDAQTGGNLLYTETIGAVTLDDNGVYSFQFGGAGTSNTQVTEDVATTDGIATMFQKVLDKGPVVAGSVSVTDGTYTWSQSAGSSSEDDFAGFYSTNLSRITVNYYSGAPTSGSNITATYRYEEGGIVGALSSGAEHWMALSVDGTAQGTRQRVLAVPFASVSSRSLVAERANFVNESNLFTSTELMSSMIDEISLTSGISTSEHRLVSFKEKQDEIIPQDRNIPWIEDYGLVITPTKLSAGGNKNVSGSIDNLNCRVSTVSYTADNGGNNIMTHTKAILFYEDNTSEEVAVITSWPTRTQSIKWVNPQPQRVVTKIEFVGLYFGTVHLNKYVSFTDATYEISGPLSFGAAFSQPISSSSFIVYLEREILEKNPDVKASYTVHAGGIFRGPFDFGRKVDLPDSLDIDSFRVVLDGPFSDETPPISKVLFRRFRQ